MLSDKQKELIESTLDNLCCGFVDAKKRYLITVLYAHGYESGFADALQKVKDVLPVILKS